MSWLESGCFISVILIFLLMLGFWPKGFMREVRGDCENFNPFRVFKYPCFELNGRNATDVLLESANIAWNYTPNN